MSVKFHEAIILRKCRMCGLEATNELELELFVKDKKSPFNHKTLCKECYNKYSRTLPNYKSGYTKYNLKTRERQAEKAKERYHYQRQKAMFLLCDGDVKCSHCEESDLRVLAIDHVNNNGYKERRKLSKEQIVRKIISNDINEMQTEYQVLCWNCNWLKKEGNKAKYMKVSTIIDGSPQTCTKCKRLLPSTAFYKKINQKSSHCKDCEREKARNRFHELQFKAMEKLSDKIECNKCGNDNFNILNIDHLEGTGRKRSPRDKICREIISMDNPREHYQILCFNCNWLKYTKELEGVKLYVSALS